MKSSIIAIALATFFMPGAHAQTYPNKPITMLVPFAAGGPTDTVARLTAEAMSRSLKQQVLVENAPGAGGTIASQRAADAAPDGYTILVHHVGMSTAPSLYRKLSYDPLKAFAPIGLITDAPMTVIGRDDLPANTLKELIDYIKKNGTKVTYANSGPGAASHLCGMLLMSSIGTEMTTVPYKGNGPIMTDLLGKQIDLTCDQATNTVSVIQAKKVKAYAVTTAVRLKALPDLPTAQEAGLADFQFGVWHGLYAPAGTPPDVMTKLVAALQAAVEDSNLKARFAAISTEPVSKAEATPEALSKKLSGEIKRWKPLIESAGQLAN